MSYESVDELRYIKTLTDLPVIGPDIDFATDTKLDAAAIAESKLEADVNDGVEFGPTEITPLHREAAGVYASYRLFVGPTNPESAKSGLLQGGVGDDTMEFARELKEQYQSHIESIKTSEQDTSSDSTDLIVSNGDPNRRRLNNPDRDRDRDRSRR